MLRPPAKVWLILDQDTQNWRQVDQPMDGQYAVEYTLNNQGTAHVNIELTEVEEP